MKPIYLSVFLFALSISACGDASRDEAGAPVSGSEVANGVSGQVSLPVSGARKVTWEELVPEGEEERLVELYRAQAAKLGQIEEGGAGDVAVQIGSFSTVQALDGLRVRLPGYTVPFEYGADAQITEFLLVPYYGACLHAPPPPPNQTIYVTTTEPIELADLAQAVWIEGTLRATKQATALADAAYTVEMDSIEAY